MKRYIALFLAALCLLVFCSCNKPSAPPSADTTDTAASETQDYKKYLLGEWISEGGEREPIDETTVGGTPYTIKDIIRDERGNLTFYLTVGGNDVQYKVYRYKVNYAEYSYMEATLGTKDVVFKFHK